jgi:hypothetical protein
MAGDILIEKIQRQKNHSPPTAGDIIMTFQLLVKKSPCNIYVMIFLSRKKYF